MPPCYREYLPAERSRDDVECFWTHRAPPRGTGGAPRLHRVLPDGCTDIVVRWDGLSIAESFVAGTQTGPILVELDPQTSLLGVRFRPGRAGAYLGIAASAARDSRPALIDVWGGAASRLEARLAEAASPEHAVRFFESELSSRRTDAVDERVAAAVAALERSGGSVSIADLAGAVRLSRQHLTRRFTAAVGIGPKTFARVVRLRRIVHAIESTVTPDWRRLALHHGFFDQSHLAAEIHALAGTTPGGLAAERHRVPFLQDGHAVAGHDAVARSRVQSGHAAHRGAYDGKDVSWSE